MKRKPNALILLLAWITMPDGALADRPADPEEIVVYGRSQPLVGTAGAASEGLVGYDDIQLPPLLRVGELVEAVPGMVATQHSGTGKANQYFLRGFNLDHGTDFAASVDGMPINMRTHGHGQGYLDLNFLIPELVETTAYRKGPYSARVGDFASAGSVDFKLYEQLRESQLQLTVGEYDYRRALLAASSDAGDGVLTGALDLVSYGGPWELDENLEQYKFYLGYAFDIGGLRARLTAQGYDSEWDSTDQVPRRAVETGLISPLGYIDPDLGGQSSRYALAAALEGERWSASTWFIDYDFRLFSNFTYFLDDPAAGDEFEQRDRRRIWGARIAGSRNLGADGAAVFRWGSELRYDDIDEVGLYSTVARKRTAIRRQDRVEEFSAGVFAEAELPVGDRFRAIAGLRGDFFDWAVEARRAENSGRGDDALLSPKLTGIYRLSDQVEAYANWGRGFHSNDVRGATIRVDPVSGDPVDSVDALVESEGAELGLRFERGRVFNATLVGFWLELDSELVYVGDAGVTEPNDATERTGIEVAAFWRPTAWLAVNSAYAYTDARFKQDQGGGREIPGAVESTFTLGLNGVWENGLDASVNLRFLGSAPLIEDNSVRSDDSTLVNAGLGYRRGPLRVSLEVFNLFDSDDDDIAYFYASRLPGEPAEGVEDVHFHPLEPRSLRLSFSLNWD